MLKDLILFGTGEKGKKLSALLEHYEVGIQYWLDSDSTKWNKLLDGKKIYPPCKIRDEDDAKICISATDTKEEMYHAILDYGVSKERIVPFGQMIVNGVSAHYVWNKQNIFSDSPNIIFDCSKGMLLGGVEAWSKSLLKELKKRGQRAYLLSPCGNYPIENEIKQNMLWVDSQPKNLFSYENIENIITALQRKMPCVLISSFPGDMLLAACCLKKRYPEYVRIFSVIHQGTSATCKEHVELEPYIEKYIAVSRDIQEEMVKRGIEKDKVLHMTCPVDCIEPYVRDYTRDNKKELRIGYAGRIEVAQKRMDQLLSLIKELEELHTNYHMEIAGNGSYLRQLKEQIEHNDLSHKVTLLGEIKRREIASFWSKQDVCVNLSDFEGRSISIMEAMKNGAVPVVTATSGVKEDIIHGENGYMVDIGNYKDMAMKIDYLANNRQLLSLFGNKAHEIITQKSNKDVHMNFWNKILQKTDVGGNDEMD